MNGASVWDGSGSSTLFRTPSGEFLSSALPTGRMCTAGEVWRGESLIVWAITEGRSAAFKGRTRTTASTTYVASDLRHETGGPRFLDALVNLFNP